MKKLYQTREWKGYGKQNYYRNEYRLEDGVVNKYKCNRHKFFDGRENEWSNKETLVDSWKVGSDAMPDWLRSLI